MSLVHRSLDETSQENLRCVVTYTEFFSCCMFAGCVMECVCEFGSVIATAQIYSSGARKLVKFPRGRTPEAK